jgi:hypothetical protein
MTERGSYKFTVKETADGTPWIAAEPAGGTLASFPGSLGFELRPGTSYDFAKTLAGYLNTHIVGITHTQV